MIAWGDRVASAFDAAADYDAHAGVQREVAEWLSNRIADAGPHARVLEIGCGTGLLGEAALVRSGARDWLMTDVAPTMVARARARLGDHPGTRFATLDGERPALAGGQRFDLICSSLAAQWFGDLPAALDRLAGHLEPGGALMLTTLCEGTFAEWRTAMGEAAGTPDFPSLAALAALRPGGMTATIELRRFTARHATAHDFIRSIKALGAGTPRPGHRAVGPAALRAAAGAFERSGSVATYQVALLDFQRQGETR